MIVFWREVAKLASLFSTTRAVKAYFEVKKTKRIVALNDLCRSLLMYQNLLISLKT